MLTKNNNLVIMIVLIGSSILLFNYSDPLATAQDDPDAYLYQFDIDTISLDGEIGLKEYPSLFDIYSVSGNLFGKMGWGHNNTHLAIGLQTFGTGWLGLGFGDVGVQMSGADIIMASVVGNTVTVKDMHGTGQTAPVEDTDTYIDQNFVAGEENINGTTIELIIPLTSNDSAGSDLQWQVNSTYGFFIAYHISDDNFKTLHTSHTQSLEVEILNETADLIIKLDIFQEISYLKENSTLIITATIYEANTTIPVEGLNILFYRKTHLGKLFINSSESNSMGIAKIITPTDYSGNVTIIASFPGTQNIEKVEVVSSIEIAQSIEIQDENYGDLRDFFDQEHLMRTFLLISFFSAILFVLAIYLSVILDIFKIKRIGKISVDSMEV